MYKPYLLMNKKRYAGLLWTNSEKYDKMDTKVHTSAQLSSMHKINIQIVKAPHEQAVTSDWLRLPGKITWMKGLCASKAARRGGRDNC